MNDIVIKSENICVYNIYLIWLRPVFNQTYEQNKQIENTYELFIANWYYPFNNEIVFYK